MNKKLSFANAIAYMTANPGKEVTSPGGISYEYRQGSFWKFGDNELASFHSYAIDGEWTIPEPELPEVEVDFYLGEEGNIEIVKSQSDHEAYISSGPYTKCKIKFNQGEE